MSTEKTKTGLSKKTISAIADQVEARLRQDGSQPQAEAVARKTLTGQHGSRGVFFWGAASGLALAVAAPLLGRQARPALRGAVKGGILAGRYVQRVASGVKEDIQDLSAEAAADLDVEGKESGDTGRPKRKAN